MTSAALALKALSPPEHMTLLDVTVRELIQNSLDAKHDEQTVSVSFDWLKPSPQQQHFWKESIGGDSRGTLGHWIFNQLGNDWNLLRIKDEGTVGLGGSVIPSGAGGGEHRFNRIAFQFGVPNGDAHAGGSWGLGGKTIVFRLEPDAGLVAYFSKPVDGIPRLILCHCFDHNHQEQEQKTPFAQTCCYGFAWWGEPSEGGPVQGVEGDRAIYLARGMGFDIPDDASALLPGTQILVPIRTRQLRELVARERETDIYVQDSPDLLRLKAADQLLSAVQRWYWPRLNCRAAGPDFCTRADLKVTVGNWDEAEGLLRRRSPNGHSENSAFYRLLENLYRKTFQASDSHAIQPDKHGRPVLGRLAKLNSADENDLVAFGRERRALGLDGDGTNFWVIAHIRDAGMVVSYRLMPSMVNGAGKPGVLTNQDGSMHIAVARVIGTQMVDCAPPDHPYRRRSLEEIFRITEDAAHSSWSCQRLIEKRDKIGSWPQHLLSAFHRKTYEILAPATVAPPPKDGSSGNPLYRLAQSLGASLLPLGFGEGPSGHRGGGGGGSEGGSEGGGGAGPSSAKIRLADCVRDGEKALFELYAEGLKPLEYLRVEFVVLGERGKIDRLQWNKDSADAFPIQLTTCRPEGASIKSIQIVDQNISITENGRFFVGAMLNHGDWFVDVKYTSLRAEKV